MSRPSPDEDDGKPREQSRSALLGTAARWALFAWLTRHGLVAPVVVCAVGAVVMMGLLAVLGVVSTNVSDDVRYQCVSAIGPDPSASVTPIPTTRGAGGEPAEMSTPPSANPYASLEPDDGDSAWERACFGALKDAPYQEPPVRAPNDGAAADCAARLELSQVGQPATQVSLVRSVVYQASTASLRGRCEQPVPVTDSSADVVDGVAPTASAAADPSADAVAPTVDLPPESTCPASGEVLLMPDTVAAQGVCGQRVDVTAVSAGDLVFWDHRDYAPQRVGIAVGPTELVTTDETTGLVVRQAIPVDDDVRVKRVLPLG